MAQNMRGYEIQAMPITKQTFIGVASHQQILGGTVMMLEDGDITFHYDSEDKVFTGLKGGTNFQADFECEGITSSAKIAIT